MQQKRATTSASPSSPKRRKLHTQTETRQGKSCGVLLYRGLGEGSPAYKTFIRNICAESIHKLQLEGLLLQMDLCYTNILNCTLPSEELALLGQCYNWYYQQFFYTLEKKKNATPATPSQPELPPIIRRTTPSTPPQPELPPIIQHTTPSVSGRQAQCTGTPRETTPQIFQSIEDRGDSDILEDTGGPATVDDGAHLQISADGAVSPCKHDNPRVPRKRTRLSDSTIPDSDDENPDNEQLQQEVAVAGLGHSSGPTCASDGPVRRGTESIASDNDSSSLSSIEEEMTDVEPDTANSEEGANNVVPVGSDSERVASQSESPSLASIEEEMVDVEPDTANSEEGANDVVPVGSDSERVASQSESPSLASIEEEMVDVEPDTANSEEGTNDVVPVGSDSERVASQSESPSSVDSACQGIMHDPISVKAKGYSESNSMPDSSQTSSKKNGCPSQLQLVAEVGSALPLGSQVRTPPPSVRSSSTPPGPLRATEAMPNSNRSRRQLSSQPRIEQLERCVAGSLRAGSGESFKPIAVSNAPPMLSKDEQPSTEPQLGSQAAALAPMQGANIQSHKLASVDNLETTSDCEECLAEEDNLVHKLPSTAVPLVTPPVGEDGCNNETHTTLGQHPELDDTFEMAMLPNALIGDLNYVKGTSSNGLQVNDKPTPTNVLSDDTEPTPELSIEQSTNVACDSQRHDPLVGDTPGIANKDEHMQSHRGSFFEIKSQAALVSPEFETGSIPPGSPPSGSSSGEDSDIDSDKESILARNTLQQGDHPYNACIVDHTGPTRFGDPEGREMVLKALSTIPDSALNIQPILPPKLWSFENVNGELQAIDAYKGDDRLAQGASSATDPGAPQIDDLPGISPSSTDFDGELEPTHGGTSAPAADTLARAVFTCDLEVLGDAKLLSTRLETKVTAVIQEDPTLNEDAVWSFVAVVCMIFGLDGLTTAITNVTKDDGDPAEKVSMGWAQKARLVLADPEAPDWLIETSKKVIALVAAHGDDNGRTTELRKMLANKSLKESMLKWAAPDQPSDELMKEARRQKLPLVSSGRTAQKATLVRELTMLHFGMSCNQLKYRRRLAGIIINLVENFGLGVMSLLSTGRLRAIDEMSATVRKRCLRMFREEFPEMQKVCRRLEQLVVEPTMKYADWEEGDMTTEYNDTLGEARLWVARSRAMESSSFIGLMSAARTPQGSPLVAA